MGEFAIFLVGFLVGGIAVRMVIAHAYRRGFLSYPKDERYAAARQAAARYLQNCGTLNAIQLAHLSELDITTATSYLDKMEADGLVRRQGHRGRGVFYTRM